MNRDGRSLKHSPSRNKVSGVRYRANNRFSLALSKPQTLKKITEKPSQNFEQPSKAYDVQAGDEDIYAAHASQLSFMRISTPVLPTHIGQSEPASQFRSTSEQR